MDNVLIIEGVLLSKLPFRERDLICHILTRSGQKQSVIFYGGAGGGKLQKGTQLQLGSLCRIHLRRSKKSSGLKVAGELEVLWSSAALGQDYKSFSIMCFFLEIAALLSPEESFGDEGCFRVLSNGLFYLEQCSDLQKLTSLFLSKFIWEQGIAPDPYHCGHCMEVVFEKPSFFVLEEGHFSCLSCSSPPSLKARALSLEFQQGIDASKSLPFKDYANFVEIGVETLEHMLHYLLSSFGQRPERIKSWQAPKLAFSRQASRAVAESAHD